MIKINKLNNPGFFEAAHKGKTAFWTFIVVLVLVFIGYVVGQLPLTLVIRLKEFSDSLEGGGVDFEKLQQTGDLSLLGLELNLTLFLLLLSFAGALAGLILGVSRVLDRPWKTIINYNGTICWKKIGFGFGFWLIMAFALESISLFTAFEDYEFSFSFFPFLILLIIALTLLPVQTSFEELFFRGWLLQKLGFYLDSKYMALIVSTICFAAIHFMNPEVHKYGLVPMMIYYIQAGLLLGIITVLDDSLELALGAHFAINFFSAVFFNYEAGALQTYALFQNTSAVNVPALNVGFFFVSIFFILICYKKYNWKFSKLFEPIQKPDDEPNRLDS